LSEARTGTTQKGRRKQRIIAVVAAATLVVLVSVSLTLAAGDIAFLSRGCGSCHVIRPSVATWRRGAHSKVGCYKCHEKRASFPARIESRTTRLRRDVWEIVTGTAETSPTTDLAIVDASCRQCHNPKRQPTSGGAVTIDHVKHVKRNDSCLSCHRDSGHPGPASERGLERMQLCFDCHSKKRKPTASRQCAECHPSDFELTPVSHKPAGKWAKQHGEVALADRAQCSMCHLGQLCAECHGLVMPHPAGWKGSKQGHPSLSKKDGTICVKCHKAEPEPCSTCHHSKHDPRRGPWAKNHSFVVKSGGAAQCMDCHAAHYCAECHTKPTL
jgi:hypothetical protein